MKLTEAVVSDGEGGVRPKRVYIAGPMRGFKFYNFSAFDRAKLSLIGLFDVASPADLDRSEGFDPFKLPSDTDWTVFPRELGDPADILLRDLTLLAKCDSIYLLDGWEKSKGATIEHAFALFLGKSIVYESAVQDRRVTEDDGEDILDEALRLTKGDRQNSYGPPDQDFARTAGMWTSMFDTLLAEGQSFEPMHVALAMIALKLSRQTHQRKRDNWTDIAGYARCGHICDTVAKREIS